MTLHASPLATRYRTQRSSLRHAVCAGLAQTLHALSLRLDALATALQAPPRAAAAGPAPDAVLEFSRDPATGHGVLYENGERRFTFLQGLERL